MKELTDLSCAWEVGGVNPARLRTPLHNWSKRSSLAKVKVHERSSLGFIFVFMVYGKMRTSESLVESEACLQV